MKLSYNNVTKCFYVDFNFPHTKAFWVDGKTIKNLNNYYLTPFMFMDESSINYSTSFLISLAMNLNQECIFTLSWQMISSKMKLLPLYHFHSHYEI